MICVCVVQYEHVLCCVVVCDVVLCDVDTCCVVCGVPWADEQHEVQSTMNIEQRDSEPGTSITQNLLPAEEGKGPVQLG